MTLAELKTQLETTGLPVAYDFIPEEAFTGYPIITYREVLSNVFYADGVVYFATRHIEVELYTKTKEPVNEAKVETALASIPWQKSEDYIDNEKCYQIKYELEV